MHKSSKSRKISSKFIDLTGLDIRIMDVKDAMLETLKEVEKVKTRFRFLETF